MTSVTKIEIRGGWNVCVASVASSVKRDDYASLHRKGLSSGSRARIEHFYDRIDRDLAKWERDMFPRKKRRHGKKRRRRHGKPVQLLKVNIGKGVR